MLCEMGLDLDIREFGPVDLFGHGGLVEKARELVGGCEGGTGWEFGLFLRPAPRLDEFGERAAAARRGDSGRKPQRLRADAGGAVLLVNITKGADRGDD